MKKSSIKLINPFCEKKIMSDFLEDGGKLVGSLLLIWTLLSLAITLFKFYFLNAFELDFLIQEMILSIIPTEVGLIESLVKYPIY